MTLFENNKTCVADIILIINIEKQPINIIPNN